MQKTAALTNLQNEILKVFSFDVSEEELKDIKGLLATYFANKASKEMDDFLGSNGIESEIIKDWSKEHMRTKYD
jgi:hypothetical protein